MEVSSKEMEQYLANPSLSTSAGSDWGRLTVRSRLETGKLPLPADSGNTRSMAGTYNRRRTTEDRGKG
jgi:hypothetical protein